MCVRACVSVCVPVHADVASACTKGRVIFEKRGHFGSLLPVLERLRHKNFTVTTIIFQSFRCTWKDKTWLLLIKLELSLGLN